ncbi:MAG: FHA domain-containing protein [Chloroflexi bacterium]|nr:FHA domain-containing protein [Chloroflexota bacterium]MCI0649973.1 FHA domain-containing protein [Chloroflexota bacterium]MCI0725770.1 FHA domain-containing protein [Chloroflexota bacterium]
MSNKTISFFAAALSLALFLLFNQPSQAQGIIDDIIITGVDASEFPQVQVRIRPLDRLGVPVASLSTGVVQVSENGEGVVLESLTEVEEGLWLHFVIDAGAGLTDSRWSKMRQGILSFVQTTPWMKENLDHVAITVVEANGVRSLIDFTSDPGSLATTLERYSPPGGTGFSAPLPALDSILESMDLLSAAQGQAKFIVFFSSRLESGGSTQANALAEKAADLDIPIYTVSVRESVELGAPPPPPAVGPGTPTPPTPVTDQPLADLGEQSGGMFTHYQDGDSLNNAYRAIVEHRRQYDLSYRSQLSLSGTREVRVNAAVGEGTISAVASYTVEVNPPRVVIEQPGSGEVITRESQEYTTNLGAISPTTRTVIATVIFPDEHLRRLQSAVLLVNGESAARVDFPSVRIELPWNLRNIQALGMNEFTLQILVTDELGLDAESSPVTARVEVKVPPPPTETAAGPTIIVTPVPIECISPDPFCTYLERPVRGNPISIVSLGVAGLSLVMVAVVWVNRDKAPVKAVRNTVTGVIDQMTRKLKRGAAEAKAYLVVLDGDSNVGKALEIYGNTPVGRSRQNAELLFQQTDPNSPISRLHCTILDEEDHFMIRDEDSANGTFLNGRKLQPLEPEEIHDGDEIELARVERGGVRLLFQLAVNASGDGMSEDTRQTRRTRSPGRTSQKDEHPQEEDRF